MANSYIIDIGMNDSLQDVVRKSNHNFRTIYGSQSKAMQIMQRDGSFSGDYNDLINKPSIEDVELLGNKDMPDLGIFVDWDVDIDEHPQSDMYALGTDEINALWNGGL